jgi:hypothetical protein
MDIEKGGGGETKDRRKLEATQMNFLRNAEGYTLKGRIRNLIIRRELNIFSLNKIL